MAFSLKSLMLFATFLVDGYKYSKAKPVICWNILFNTLFMLNILNKLNQKEAIK